MTGPSDEAKMLHAAFTSPHGAKALEWMRARTVDAMLSSDVPEAVLRDLEGQRRLVRLIEANIRRVKEGTF